MISEVWRWQSDAVRLSSARAATVLPDLSLVLAGAVRNQARRDLDFFAAKFDATTGTPLWQWTDGTDGYESIVGAAAAGEEGSVTLVGKTSGQWDGNTRTHVSAAAVKLDANGAEVWRRQYDDGGGYFSPNSVAAADDGSIFVGGITSDPISEVTDFVLMKLDADGNPLWSWTGGTTDSDNGLGVAALEDGSAVIVGSVGYPQNNFTAVKVDEDGQQVWQWEAGTSQTDLFYSATSAEDGAVVICGHTSGSYAAPNAGSYDAVAVKLDADGNELWSWQDGTSSFDFVTDCSMADDGSVILGGSTNGDWIGRNKGSGDFMAVALHSSDGSELWRWQDGTNQGDFIRGVATGPDGLVALAGDAGSFASAESLLQIQRVAAVVLQVDASNLEPTEPTTSEGSSLETTP